MRSLLARAEQAAWEARMRTNPDGLVAETASKPSPAESAETVHPLLCRCGNTASTTSSRMLV